MLRNVARIFREDPNSIEQNRSALMARLGASARPAGRVVIGVAELDSAAQKIAGVMDVVHGGMRGRRNSPTP